jgi:hypothetical protein
MSGIGQRSSSAGAYVTAPPPAGAFIGGKHAIAIAVSGIVRH